MFESMFRSYNHLLTKFNIKNNNKICVPHGIQCTSFHSTLSSLYMEKLYKEIYSINKDNYRVVQNRILRALQRLMLEIGNNCSFIIDYIDYFENIIKGEKFLEKDNYHNPWLLLQVLSSRSKFINSWGKYVKMGHYIGNLFAWYKIYAPSIGDLNAFRLFKKN